ncbi:MASE1 domain-containing protein [Roseateles sp. UC29_93]|uniref:MASE1 domain-containing protein n=1 Tax=Roseateles sp. UC29_93 TaxID=3350177 RepID=UPI00366EE645
MQHLMKAALVALLWLGAAMLSRSMAHAATQTTLVWLSSGITFAALLVSARWAWPALLAGAGVAATVWGLVDHRLGVGPALAFAGIEVSSMALGAWIATLDRQDSQTPRGAALLMAGAVAASLIGATLATLLWGWQRPDADLGVEWRAWALSTIVGLLLVAPLVTAFQGFRIRRSGGLPMAPFLGGVVAFAGFIIAVLLVFSDQAAQRWGGVAATLAYVPMPFLLVASLMWGARGGTLATLLGALLIIGRTAQGDGPFAFHEGFRGEAVVEVQGFVMVWAAVLLVTRALAEGRRAALARADEWHLRYERTLQAVGVASVEYDATTGRATWGGGCRPGPGPRGVGRRHYPGLARLDRPRGTRPGGSHLAGGGAGRARLQRAGLHAAPAGRTGAARARAAGRGARRRRSGRAGRGPAESGGRGEDSWLSRPFS